MRHNEADYLIVGAGSAGCVLADRLSADGRTKVLLVEAGGPDGDVNIEIPAVFTRLFATPFNWGYLTTPQTGLGGRPVFYPRGKGLGGSSSINAQLWTRGHQEDFDNWAAAGLPGWGYQDLLPYYERAESGPVRLDEIRYPSPSTSDFLTACAALGYQPVEDQPDGYAAATVNHHRGLRWSAADGYLKPAKGRKNLEVLTGALVHRVLFEGSRAVGVELETADGGKQQIRAAREVILAAGSIGSTQLLMLSGIGPAEHLASHGLTTLVDAPAVGQGLTDHLLVPLAFAAEGLTSPGVDAGPDDLQRYLRDRVGPLNSNLAEALLFLRTSPELSAPDIELVLMQVPFGQHETQTENGLTVGVLLLQPESRGRITLNSADPHDAPLIDPNYLSDRDGADLRTLVTGVRRAQEVLAQPGFAKWLGEPLTPGALAQTDEEIADYIRRTALSLFHPVSTTRLGADPESVVDPEFRVRGAEGLRVVDAGTMPHIIRGHTHAATVLLAELASDLIRASEPADGVPGDGVRAGGVN